MKATKLFCLIALIALFGLVKNVDWQEEDGVLVLTDDNFDQAINHYEHILVEFYAPWCGHCKKLTPEYAKAAQELKNSNPHLALAKVDATVQKSVASRFEVRGYPTLKFFSNGTPSEYNGGRTHPEIVSWMRKKTGPASRTLSTVGEVELFYNGAEVAVVYFGDNSGDLSVYERVARSNDDLLFASCASEECFAHYGVSSGSIVLFKKFDEGKNVFTGSLTEEALKQFLAANSSPLVMKFDEKAAQLVFGKATPGLFLYRDANSENTQELDNIVRSVAKQVAGKIKVVITDIKVGLETRLAEYIGVTAQDLPSVRIHDTRNDLKKYNMQGSITEENVLKFINDWENGRLRPHLKSAEIPEKQEGDVVVLVGKSFHNIVMDPTKDVLVEFYAPWCGHCKKLEPIYNELAEKLKDNTNVVIAKMDSTANEVEEVSIQGFPTIKFWPANNKSRPIDFEGDRTVDGFVKFLEKHSTATKVEKKDDL
jgi:protein disulfide-isomerase A1